MIRTWKDWTLMFLFCCICPPAFIGLACEIADYIDQPRCGQCRSKSMTEWHQGWAVTDIFYVCNDCGWKSQPSRLEY